MNREEVKDDFTEFCGDETPHESHDDEGTAIGGIFIHTCPGFPILSGHTDADGEPIEYIAKRLVDGTNE